MTLGDLSGTTPVARNRAERRSADRQRRRRKGMAIATGASVMVSGLNLLAASPAGADSHCDEDLTVTDGGDSGVGTLRAAIGLANADVDASTICFDVAEVVLTSGSLTVTEALTLYGPGTEADEPLTIAADGTSSNDGERLFYLAPSAGAVVISGLTMSGADADGGAAIYARRVDLTLSDVHLTGNQGVYGGALYFSAPYYAFDLAIVDSMLSGNVADQDGGAAYIHTGGNVSITNTVMAQNEAGDGGGALYVNLEGADASISGSTFTGNVAEQAGGALKAQLRGDASLVVAGTSITGNSARLEQTVQYPYYTNTEVTGDGGGVDAYLSGTSRMTVSAASVISGNTAGESGGGLRVRQQDASTLEISDSTIQTNAAQEEDGGGLRLEARDDAVATVASTVVTGNTTPGSSGAGIWTQLYNQVSASITDSTISHNLAGYDGGGALAGIYDEASLSLTATDFTSNAAGGNGGGLRAQAGNDAVLSINGGTTSLNSADHGGGLRLDARSAARVSVDGATISGNTASERGAGAYLFSNYADAEISVSNSTISGNTADAEGGGLLVGGSVGPKVIEGSTISANQGSGGGGVMVDVGPLDIRRSTITGNTTGGDGGGILARASTNSKYGNVMSSTTSDVTLAGSIVSENSAVGAGGDLAARADLSGMGTPLAAIADPATFTASYSLVGDPGATSITTTGGNLIGADPQLGALADNGGTTPTHLPASSSPVRDAGDPAYAGASLDQRGGVRVVNGRIDIGSVELAAVVPFVPETSTTTTPPTTNPPPTTPPAEQPAPSAPSPGGSAQPTFVAEDGTQTVVPLPPAAPANQVRSSVAVSPTESIAVTGDGRVFSTNPAHNFGQIRATTRLRAPMVGMGIHWTRRSTAAVQGFEAAASEEWVPSGYWLLGADGGVFSFGTAKFLGSTGLVTLNKPVVAMAPTPTGNGYWLIASDGGVFSFGDARFFGSTGSIKLAKPVVSLLPTATGLGYWLIASDGGVFSYGDARYFGSASKTGKAFTGAMRSEGGAGYWLLEADGTRTAYGDAR